MDLEVVRISPDDISLGPVKIMSPNGPITKTNVPVVVIEGTQVLNDSEGQVLLSVNNLFDTAKMAVVKLRMECSPQQAETLLKTLVNKIIKDTGWSYGDALFNLVIREWIDPQIRNGDLKLPSELEDTLRVYIAEEGGLIQWTSFPYHSPSFTIGAVVQKDFTDEDMGEEDYDDEEEDWGTGEPG